MSKSNVMQCEFCSEPTKTILFLDGESSNENRLVCQNHTCEYNNMAKEQKTIKVRREETRKINNKHGIKIKELIKLRINAQMNILEAGESIGVSSSTYSSWEREIEPIPINEYCMLLAKFGRELSNLKCGNCQFYNGDESDKKAYCDRMECEVPRCYRCDKHMKRWS